MSVEHRKYRADLFMSTSSSWFGRILRAARYNLIINDNYIILSDGIKVNINPAKWSRPGFTSFRKAGSLNQRMARIARSGKRRVILTSERLYYPDSSSQFILIIDFIHQLLQHIVQLFRVGRVLKVEQFPHLDLQGF